MTPEVAVLIFRALMEYGPGVARSLVEIFQKQEFTAADWEGVFAKAEKAYEAYVAPRG
ncbi:MAG: hypothetical protein ACYDC1_25055 [Limisphaerales bacterium]